MYGHVYKRKQTKQRKTVAMNITGFYYRRVAGFISKNIAHDMLRGCNSGTFLLRFSETEIGGISVAYVNTYDGGKKASYSIRGEHALKPGKRCALQY